MLVTSAMRAPEQARKFSAYPLAAAISLAGGLLLVTLGILWAVADAIL